jgi:hypothetical protein
VFFQFGHRVIAPRLNLMILRIRILAEGSQTISQRRGVVQLGGEPYRQRERLCREFQQRRGEGDRGSHRARQRQRRGLQTWPQKNFSFEWRELISCYPFTY